MEDTFKMMSMVGEKVIVFGEYIAVEQAAIEAWGNYADITKANRADIVLHKLRFREIPAVERWLREYKEK